MRLALELTALFAVAVLAFCEGYATAGREPCVPIMEEWEQCGAQVNLLNKERAAALLDLQRCRQQVDEVRRLCEKTEDDDDR